MSTKFRESFYNFTTSYSSLLKAPTSTFTIRNLFGIIFAENHPNEGLTHTDSHCDKHCLVFLDSGIWSFWQNKDFKNFREISLTPKYSNNVIAGIYVLSGHPLWSCIATIYDFVITHNCGKWEMWKENNNNVLLRLLLPYTCGAEGNRGNLWIICQFVSMGSATTVCWLHLTP